MQAQQTRPIGVEIVQAQAIRVMEVVFDRPRRAAHR